MLTLRDNRVDKKENNTVLNTNEKNILNACVPRLHTFFQPDLQFAIPQKESIMSLGSGWFDAIHVISPHFSGYLRPLPLNSLHANFYFIVIFYYKNIVWFLKGETHFCHFG